MTTDTPTRPLTDDEKAARRVQIQADADAWVVAEIAALDDEIIVSADA